MSLGLNGSIDPAPTPRELANAVEILGNVLYLIEYGPNDRDSILMYLSMTESAMDILRRMALQAQRREASDDAA